MQGLLIAKTNKLNGVWNVLSFLLVLSVSLLLHPQSAHATGGCDTTPPTDYGQVSYSAANGNAVTVASTGTYYVWTRISAPSPAAAGNVYYLDVDGSSCFTVGGSQVPVYSGSPSTYFTGTNGSSFASQNGADNSNWVNTTGAGTTNSDGTTNASASRISVNLTAGSHNLKLIGAAAGVVVDRIILVQESNCVPDNTQAGNYGDNCAVSDTTAPTVGVTSVNTSSVVGDPTPGPSVSSPVTVAISASDNVGVTKVELYVDGSSTAVQPVDTVAPYNYSNLSLPPGAHYVIAKAYDASGNVTSSTRADFVVADTTSPTTSITAPATGTPQSGTITVTAAASDDVGVTKVELYVDGVLKLTDTTAPYSFTLDTTTLSNSGYSLTVKAYDNATPTNHVTTSAAVAITVSNTGGTDTDPPTITITPPTTTGIAGKAYVFTPTITDASGIKQVVFQVDGSTVATVTVAPFTYTFDTTLLSNGPHVLGVKATDNSAAQNTNLSFATITVKVTPLADVNRDCRVNVNDFNSIIPRLNTTGSNLGKEDVNNDGRINVNDFNSIIPKLNTQPC